MATFWQFISMVVLSGKFLSCIVLAANSAFGIRRANMFRRRGKMYSAHAFQLPICCVCAKPVSLESSKTDERGHAVHEECYLFKLGLIEEITAQRKPPCGLRNMKMAGEYAWALTT
jgi:hypothetical protein